MPLCSQPPYVGPVSWLDQTQQIHALHIRVIQNYNETEDTKRWIRHDVLVEAKRAMSGCNVEAVT